MANPPKPVRTRISCLYLSLLIFLTRKTPNPKPAITVGIKPMLIWNEAQLMVPQDHMWKGTLKRLMMKNNHAAVPINSFLGNLMAKK